MLFKVEMKVNIPHDMPAEVAADIKAREKPTPRACKSRANGVTSGGWQEATPTSAFLMWKTTRNCRS